MNSERCIESVYTQTFVVIAMILLSSCCYNSLLWLILYSLFSLVGTMLFLTVYLSFSSNFFSCLILLMFRHSEAYSTDVDTTTTTDTAQRYYSIVVNYCLDQSNSLGPQKLCYFDKNCYVQINMFLLNVKNDDRTKMLDH